MMKFQIAFRETREALAEHDLWIASGLVEADEPFALRSEEKFTSVRMEFAADGAPLLALFTNNVYAPTYAGEPLDVDLKDSDIESLLKKQIDRVTPGPFSNAELFMRRTRIEATDSGRVVLAFSGLVGYKPPTRIDCDTVFQLGSIAPEVAPESFLRYEGRVGTDIRPDWGHPSMIASTKGFSATAFLRLPVWGFGEEPIRVGSTMHLDVQDMMSRHRALHFAVRTPSEEAEYAKLSTFMRRAGLNDFGRHPDFEEAMQKLMHAGYAAEDGTPLTRSELSARSDYMSKVVQELVARQRMSEIGDLAARLRI
ncbi:hypothetical protein GOB57_21140 [Sinorhizobium meliloti]|nr:hypothetical protein [Sinorhizobium meliloti]